MSFLELAGAVAIIHVLAAASPGPDFFLTLRNSLIYSRRSGVFTAIGFAAGNLVHISYCFLGLAVLLKHNPQISFWVRMAGGAYLMWLAIQSWLAKPSDDSANGETKMADISAWAAFRSGFFTNLLNVKCSLYFLGLFTTLITPSTPVFWIVLLCLIMLVETILWFSGVAVIFTNSLVRKAYLSKQQYVNRTLALLLAYLAIRVWIG